MHSISKGEAGEEPDDGQEDVGLGLGSLSVLLSFGLGTVWGGE